MKSKLTKATAVALTMTMFAPVSAFASESSGTLDTSFDVYSPALTIQVPLKANIEVNPFADSNATDVKMFSVASESIDIWNASVDAEKDIGIPVNATVKATITSKASDVITEYNTFTENANSTSKKINLNLTTAQTAAAIDAKTGETLTFDANKKLNFAQFETKTPAVYTTPVDSVPITKYGSLLSVDIAAPTGDTSATPPATKFTSDATKVKAAVGSFAVTGVANANADWKKDDIAVNITYEVRASKARSITTPKIATAPEFTSGTSAADVSIEVPNIGEATVSAIGLHNDGAGLYGDYIWEDGAYSVDYSTAGKAVIKIPKTDGGLDFLTGEDYKDNKQDLVIALSDGRIVVSTLTVK